MYVGLPVAESRGLAENPRARGEVVGEPHYIVQDVHRRVGLQQHKQQQFSRTKYYATVSLDILIHRNCYCIKLVGMDDYGSVADPDPYVFWPPGSGSISTTFGSGSFYHQAKIVRKH